MSRLHEPQPSIPQLTSEEARQLIGIFRAEAGLAFTGDSAFVLERRLRERVIELGLFSFAQYVEFLKNDTGGKKELEEALELVTTHETYFFREEYQLRAFESEVLPQLQKLTENRKRLSIWSAGCSTGEEAYTLAMIIARTGLFSQWEVRIIGSDLSRRCITAARRGIYGSASFRVVPREFRQTYFTETSEGTSITPTIRNVCTFSQHNLLDQDRATVIGRVDAIFCRNVLIYLDTHARQRVIEVLYERLAPGGFLMLGHSESLLHVPSAFEAVHLREDLVYRKPEQDVLGPNRPRIGTR